jgi:hypothetical protein
MTQNQKVLVALAVLAVAGIAANRLVHPVVSDRAALACSRVGGDGRRDCFARLFSEQLVRHGVAAAMASLQRLTASDGYVREHEHEIAHGIGIESYRLYPDIVSTFVECGDGSASGCRHGFVQAYLESRDQISGADLQGLCRPFEDTRFNRSLLFQCIHGMGHGLTMFHGHNAPLALADCDSLAQPWDQTSCYGGVFMETFVNATSPHHPGTGLSSHSQHHMSAASFKAIDRSDPLYPCSIMQPKYLYACYQIQTSVILYLNGGDIGATARVCDRAPADMRPSCYESLGRDVTAFAERDPVRTARLCAKGTLAYRGSCYSGAARSLVNWSGKTDEAFELCRIVARDAQNAQGDGRACYAGLGVSISTLFAAGPAREEQCLRAQQPEAVNACRQGAGIAASR